MSGPAREPPAGDGGLTGPSRSGASRGCRWRWLLLAALLPAAGPVAGAEPPSHNRILSGQWFHAPVADDDCTVCHTLHGESAGPSLRNPIPDLCYQCHEDLAAKDVVHEPVGAGRCTDCHAVHTSEVRPLLTKRIPELCLDCHPLDSAHVARNTLCTSCHGVHSSETARFLKGERTRNCGRCHRDKREGDSVHAPAREGKCLTCHFTHPDPRFATQRFRAPYPAGPRAAYAPGAYGLCDRCHDPALHADLSLAGTGFRTDRVNLHARHAQAGRGVGCSACHDLHGTRNPALLADWLRLPGEQPTPMRFLMFSVGGSCGPSCHPTATYLRGEGAELGEEP